MKKSRSLSQSTLNSPAISSKINVFKEYVFFLKKEIQSITKEVLYQFGSQQLIKMPSINSGVQRNLSKQSQRKRIPSSANNSSQKQVLNILIDSNELNPQKRFTVMNLKQSILLQELDSKAMEITRYTERNATLLNQKQTLQNKISQLKRKIAQEQKRLSEAKFNCGDLRNEIQLTQQRYDEKSALRKQLIKKCNQTFKDNNNLKLQLSQAQQESNYNQKHIDLLKNEINNLSNKISNTNALLYDEQIKRLKTKDNLSLQLKVMENDAIIYQQLVSQKEHLKSQIDKAFSDNKMQLDNRKEIMKSRLSVNSNKK